MLFAISRSNRRRGVNFLEGGESEAGVSEPNAADVRRQTKSINRPEAEKRKKGEKKSVPEQKAKLQLVMFPTKSSEKIGMADDLSFSHDC